MGLASLGGPAERRSLGQTDPLGQTFLDEQQHRFQRGFVIFANRSGVRRALPESIDSAARAAATRRVAPAGRPKQSGRIEHNDITTHSAFPLGTCLMIAALSAGPPNEVAKKLTGRLRWSDDAQGSNVRRKSPDMALWGAMKAPAPAAVRHHGAPTGTAR